MGVMISYILANTREVNMIMNSGKSFLVLSRVFSIVVTIA